MNKTNPPGGRRDVIREYARTNTAMLEDNFKLRRLLRWALSWVRLWPDALREPEYLEANAEVERGEP